MESICEDFDCIFRFIACGVGEWQNAFCDRKQGYSKFLKFLIWRVHAITNTGYCTFLHNRNITRFNFFMEGIRLIHPGIRKKSYYNLYNKYMDILICIMKICRYVFNKLPNSWQPRTSKQCFPWHLKCVYR